LPDSLKYHSNGAAGNEMNPSGQIQHRMVKFSIEWGGWLLGKSRIRRTISRKCHYILPFTMISGAQTIFSWNLKHFQVLAPELAARIRTP
jgi:hypothetical protein